MGFGTPAEVDYGTLASLVAKGKALATTQVFHGENAGTIDKFYSNALARAIGFTTIFDPVLELFEGEHVHLEFNATSADESFFLTAQGMDFDDPSWSFELRGPDGSVAYADGVHAGHGGGMGHAMRMPDVTATRGSGRLSLVLQRDSADAMAWVGTWRLMVAYRAKDMSSMVMADIGELMFPVAAGPVRGPRFARLLLPPERRLAARAVVGKQRHAFDVRPGSTNNSKKPACAVVVNVYARTRLRLELEPKPALAVLGEAFQVVVSADVLAGNIVSSRALARLVSPAFDVAGLVAAVKPKDIPKQAVLKGSRSLKFDPALVLAALERKQPKLAALRDTPVAVAQHEGPLHVHVEKTLEPGVHHLGVYVEGVYCPDHDSAMADHPAHSHVRRALQPSAAHECTPDCGWQRFTRLLNISIPVIQAQKKRSSKVRKRPAPKTRKSPRRR